jgi:hypothetical protein
MQIVLIALAAGAVFLWIRSRKQTTTPTPPAGDPPMLPPVGFEAIPGNPTTPTTPGRSGTVAPPATGLTLATGIPSSRTSRKMASKLKTRTTRNTSPTMPTIAAAPQGPTPTPVEAAPQLPAVAVPAYRPAVSVIDTILAAPVGVEVAPIPPRPSATIGNLISTPAPSLVEQILDAKHGVMQ